mmetsp:Transcript_47831/g.83759  ORF Transcript_47831/g.83759 Transcript_47831/m.83759 type:complete len:209 (+) Transcript_47831:5876-6502(+)
MACSAAALAAMRALVSDTARCSCTTRFSLSSAMLVSLTASAFCSSSVLMEYSCILSSRSATASSRSPCARFNASNPSATASFSAAICSSYAAASAVRSFTSAATRCSKPAMVLLSAVMSLPCASNVLRWDWLRSSAASSSATFSACDAASLSRADCMSRSFASKSRMRSTLSRTSASALCKVPSRCSILTSLSGARGSNSRILAPRCS